MSNGRDDERKLLAETGGVGLCRTCHHARVITSAHGSTFYLCRLSESDAHFAKYPRLPVIHCTGYVKKTDA